MPPLCRKILVPTAGDIPACVAATSLVKPQDMPSQNFWWSARYAAGGRPGEYNGPRPARSDRRNSHRNLLKECCDDR